MQEPSTLLLNGPALRWLFAALFVAASVTHPEPTSRLKRATRDVNFYEVTRGVGDT